MNEVKNLFKNTSWMMISQLITSICAFVWTVLIARYLGVSNFGIISFGISFTLVVSILLDLGLTTYTTRNISRDNILAKEYLGQLIPLKLILGIITVVLSLIILKIWKYNSLTITITLIFIIESFFMSMGSLLNGVFQAYGKIKYQALGTIICSIIMLSLVLIGIQYNLGLIFIAGAYAISYFMMLIYLSIKTIKYITIPKFGINLEFYKKSIKLAIPFALTGLFYTIYFSIDVVMLSKLSGNYVTGIYNASYKIITVLTTFFPVYQTVVFPLMSKLFEGSNDLLKLSFAKSVKYLLLIILPITFGIIYYATPLVTLIYGNKYIMSGPVMQVLVWTVAFLFVNGAASTLLNASNKEVSVTKIYGIAAVLNIVLNFILIPLYSYHGAALATVISEIIICILMIKIIRKTDYCPDKSIFKDIFKIIFASLVMFGVLYFAGLNMWLGIVVGVVVYSVCILLFRTLDDDDKSLFHEIIK